MWLLRKKLSDHGVKQILHRVEVAFFAFDKFTSQILANKSGCVQTNFLFFLYTTSEKKEYYEALLLSYRPLQNAVFHNFSRQIIQDHRSTRGLLVKQPAGSNFWQAPNLRRNFKRVTLQRDREFIEFYFLLMVL